MIQTWLKCIFGFQTLAELKLMLESQAKISDIIFWLKKKHKYIKPSLIKFVISLYEYTYSLENNINKYLRSENKQNYIIHLCVWGEEYANKATNYLFPSLLANGNLPALTCKYNIIIFIHCDTCGYNIIYNSECAAYLKSEYNLQMEIIPTHIMELLFKSSTKNILYPLFSIHMKQYKYYLLGALQNIAMLTAQNNKALVSFLMPDMLFSKDALSNMFRHLNSNYKLILATAFRTHYPSVKHKLNKYCSGLALEIPGEELSDMQVNNMHPSASRRVVSTDNKIFNLTPQLIFSYSECVILRSSHHHPVLVDFRDIKNNVAPWYLPIDNGFIKSIIDIDLPIDSQIWVNEDSSFIGLMELSGDDAELPNYNYCSQLNFQEINNAISSYVSSQFLSDVELYVLSKRVIYAIKNRLSTYIESDILDTELIDGILKGIDRQC